MPLGIGYKRAKKAKRNVKAKPKPKKVGNVTFKKKK